jgi:hypothetical protein
MLRLQLMNDRAGSSEIMIAVVGVCGCRHGVVVVVIMAFLFKNITIVT